MNVLRSNEYVQQKFIEFNMIFDTIWPEDQTVLCGATLNNQLCTLVIPIVNQTMTVSGQVITTLPNSVLYPSRNVSFAINVIDGSVSAFVIPGVIFIDTSGNIIIKPDGAPYSGANAGGWQDICVTYPVNKN